MALETSSGQKPLEVSYSPEKHALYIDRRLVPLDARDEPQLHFFVDGSVIELIVNGKVGYTKRFYYEQSIAPEIALHVSGVVGALPKLSAWEVAPISKDRLTTPAQVF